MTLITSHYNADFDALASMVAASKLYKDSVLYMPWDLSKAVKKFFTFYKNMLPLKREKEVDFSLVDRVVIVDAMMRVASPELKKFIDEKNPEVIIYDHHFMEDNLDIKAARMIKINYGACTTHMVQELIENKIEISKDEALLYLLGIFSDTGSFTYTNTKPGDLKMAAYLMEKDINMKLFSDFLKENFETNQIKLFNRLVKNMEITNIKGYKLIITFARFKEYIQQVSDVTGHIMSMNSGDAIVSVTQMGNKIFIVGRSREPKIDVRKVIQEMKGGGHRSAAAGVIPVKKGVSIKKIKNQVYEGFIRSIEDRYTVTDIMSSPVKAVEVHTTLNDAYKICIRFNHSGLPVIREGKLSGFITKEDLEKGRMHGFGNIPVGGYMSTNVITVESDTSIMEAQRLMLKNNIGHLPVIKDGKLEGIVSRKDMLEYLYEEKPVKREKIVFMERNENIDTLLIQKAGKQAYDFIRMIGMYADQYEINAYLVGGFVRDIFLSKKDLDLDITVEGDGMKFAEFLAEKLSGTYKGFDRFKTGKIFLKNGYSIDITSARSEFYEYPAALPDIEFTPIRYDMYRRDFSINAMAIQINKDHFGKFIDYFNGYEDLQAGIIRTLYNMSFIDDPTRILRAVRFETRHGFTIEPNTLRFIKETLKHNVFDSLPGERLFDEIHILLEEENPLKVFKRLDAIGVLTRLSPELEINSKTEKLYDRGFYAHSFATLFLGEHSYSPEMLNLIILLQSVSSEEAIKISDKFRLKNEWKKALVDAKEAGTKTLEMLERPGIKESRIYHMLRVFGIETLLYFKALTEDKSIVKKIVRHILHLNNIKLEITGKDLKKLGIKESPLMGEILAKVKEAKIDGKIKNRKEELDFVKKIMKA